MPGTTDTGNHCDDCLTSITLPFTYQLYDQNFTTASVDSNGTLQFVAGVSTFTNSCLPDTGATYTIFPFWDDLYTINSGFGIFTSVSGTAPNRIFNIEWRDQYYPGTGNANFEVRLYEGQKRFDIIYGASTDSGASATVGVQRDNAGVNFTQYECSTGGLTNGLMLTFTQPSCATDTPNPTSTPTSTNTRTAVPSTSTSTAVPSTSTSTAVPHQHTHFGVSFPDPWRQYSYTRAVQHAWRAYSYPHSLHPHLYGRTRWLNILSLHSLPGLQGDYQRLSRWHIQAWQ